MVFLGGKNTFLLQLGNDDGQSGTFHAKIIGKLLAVKRNGEG